MREKAGRRDGELGRTAGRRRRRQDGVGKGYMRRGSCHGRRQGGDGGDAFPPTQKSEGDVPPEISISTDIFKELTKNFILFKIFKIKWPKSEEKTEFGGR